MAQKAEIARSETDTGRWVLVAAILASSMAFIDGSALNVALPTLQADLNASGAELLWIINAYLLMLAALILVGGTLGDRLGRKKVLMTGIGLFLLGSLSCGIAPSATILIAARLIQGIGGALMIPGSLAILSAYFSAEERGQEIGTWSAATTIVTVIGPILGGVLADIGFWRGVFLINIPLGILALIVLYLKVAESRDESAPQQIDYPGAILVALGLAGITFGFISAPGLGFTNPRVYIALSAGAMALVAFVFYEAHSDHPMLPLDLFNSRTFSGTNLLTLFLYAALSVWSFFMSLNLVQAQGYSQSLSGLAFLPFALFLTLLSRWAGQFVDRKGPRLPLIVGPTLAGLGFLMIGLPGLTNGPSDFWKTYLPGIIVLGTGMGITVAPLTTAVMDSVPTHFSGTASGVNNAASRTAGVLGIAIVGAFALFIFNGDLERHAAEIGLSSQTRSALQAEAGRLGDTHIPPGVPSDKIDSVRETIKLSFVDMFRLVMMICAGLAFPSAGMAALLVQPQFEPEP